MKTLVINTSAISGLSIQETQQDSVFCNIECAGTSSIDAAAPITVDGAFEYVLRARRVDDSNFGVQIPQQPLQFSERIKVLANGPTGKSITVYLGPDFQLVDGSTSVNIDCGTGKTFMQIGNAGVGVAILSIEG